MKKLFLTIFLLIITFGVSDSTFAANDKKTDAKGNKNKSKDLRL
jgi:hypothetical protein